LQRALGQALYGISNTINHNLGAAEDKSWAERIAYSQYITEPDRNRVRRISNDRAGEFVESINDLFSAYESIHSAEEASDKLQPTVLGVGVYYFEVDGLDGVEDRS
jgi:hypothetical protein